MEFPPSSRKNDTGLTWREGECKTKEKRRVCVCVCVCERERERESKRTKEIKGARWGGKKKGGGRQRMYSIQRFRSTLGTKNSVQLKPT